MRRLLILAGLLPLATFVLAQSPRIALKSGVGGWYMGHSAVEGELLIGARMSVGLRVGGIHGQKSTQIDLLDEKPPFLAGMFLKAGPKWHFGGGENGAMKGFAIQPQAVFSYWHDWDERGWGGLGWRWEMGLGAMCQFSYGWQPWEHVLIEPHLAFGWVSTLDKRNAINDTPPFETFEGEWSRIPADEFEGGWHSHVPLVSDLSFSAGLMIGFTL